MRWQPSSRSRSGHDWPPPPPLPPPSLPPPVFGCLPWPAALKPKPPPPARPQPPPLAPACHRLALHPCMCACRPAQAFWAGRARHLVLHSAHTVSSIVACFASDKPFSLFPFDFLHLHSPSTTSSMCLWNISSICTSHDPLVFTFRRPFWSVVSPVCVCVHHLLLAAYRFCNFSTPNAISLPPPCPGQSSMLFPN